MESSETDIKLVQYMKHIFIMNKYEASVDSLCCELICLLNSSRV